MSFKYLLGGAVLLSLAFVIGCGEPEQCYVQADCGTCKICQDGDCVQAPEICGDQKDNDCDDQVDEDCPCTGKICEDPPAAECVTARTLRTYQKPGRCLEGDCHYDHQDHTCPNACHNARCRDDVCIGLDCDDENPCTDDSCDPVEGCQNASNTASCDDGNACTQADRCSDGRCRPGESVVCDDGNLCTDDSCDSQQGCVHRPNSVFCDDGDACTMGDACADGSCRPGSARQCDDGNACTTDSCDQANGCLHVNNTAACDDKNACTEGDACADGGCRPGSAKNCDDGNPCTDDGCEPSLGCRHEFNSAPCDDQKACTVNDGCSQGKCVGESLDDDDDGYIPVACGGDDCDDSRREVNPGVFEGPKGSTACSDSLDNDCDGRTDLEEQETCGNCTSHQQCDDNNPCNGQETCVSNLCQAGTALSCDDDNVCTDDSCAPDSGCVHTHNTASCDDGNACTLADTCSAGTCKPGTARNCQDGNPCTDDSCNSETGCLHVDNTVPCDNQDACTLGDTCAGGSCQPGTAKDCNDDNPCTDDSCNPDSGCVYADNTATCSDGNACTVGDTCGMGACQPGAGRDCNDGNICTDDGCEPDTGCVHADNSVACDDGLACTSGDVCSGGICAGQASGPCLDGDGCCPAGCDMTTDMDCPCVDALCVTPGTCQQSAGVCVAGNCDYELIDVCTQGDACCPAGCDPAADGDCLGDTWIMAMGTIKYEYFFDVAKTSDGGLVVVGRGDGGGSVVKMDAGGAIQWQNIYGDGEYRSLYAIAEVAAGGYIAAGYADNTVDDDLWVLRLDANGEVIFDYLYDVDRHDQARSVQPTSDGGFVVAGFNSFQYRAWILKLDELGNLAWEKQYIPSVRASLSEILQTSDGGYIGAGYAFWNLSHGHAIMVVKLDSNGNILWSKAYEGPRNDEANAIVLTSDGGYLVAGYTFNDDGSDTTDAWILKLDANGEVLWQQKVGGEKNDEAYDVIQASDGGYVVAGTTKSFGSGASDIWLFKLGPTGSVLWQKTYGGVGSYYGRALVEFENGDIGLVGFYREASIVGDEGYVMRLDAEGGTSGLCPAGFGVPSVPAATETSVVVKDFSLSLVSAPPVVTGGGSAVHDAQMAWGRRCGAEAFPCNLGDRPCITGCCPWQVTTVDANPGAMYPSLAFDGSGTAYVAYNARLINGGSLLIHYARFNGTDWESLIVDEGNYPSLAFDLDDNPHIVYRKPYGGLRHAYWTGFTFAIEDADTLGGSLPAFVIADNQDMHVAHCNLGELRYTLGTQAGWESQSIGTGGCASPSMDLDATGLPHIVYRSVGELRYVKWTGSRWESGIIDSAQESRFCVSMVLDSSDRPHVVYYRSDTRDLQYATLDGTWMVEVLESVGDMGRGCSLAIDNADGLHISYVDQSRLQLRYTVKDTAGWSSYAVSPVYNPQTVIAMDPHDLPQIVHAYGATGLTHLSW